MQFKIPPALVFYLVITLSCHAAAAVSNEPVETGHAIPSSNIPQLIFNVNYQFGLSVLTALRHTSSNGEVSKKKSQLRFVRFMPTFNFNQANWTCRANYRFYLAFDAVREAYCEHQWNKHFSLAFGILPTLVGGPGYSSGSFWGPLPFYYGVQGDRDIGSYLTISRKRWDLELGYYFSDEYGDGDRFDRTTFDSVSSPRGSEKESGAVAGRWTFHTRTVQFYLSAQKQNTERSDGSPARQRLSISLDQQTRFSSWELDSTLGYYEFNNRSGNDLGAPHLGAFTGSVEVAPRSRFAVVRLVKNFDFDSSQLGALSCYAELSVVNSMEQGFNNGKLAVIGCKKKTKHYSVYIDLVRARNVIAVSTFDTKFLRGNSHATELQVVLDIQIF